MTTFMNAALMAIRDNLTCGHCGSRFQGSDSQARKVKYEQRTVYCSDLCRYAALRNKFSTPIPNRGPCKTCGKTFFSRSAKIFCSLGCYINSAQFRAMAATNKGQGESQESREHRAQAARLGKNVPCLECGSEFYQKRATQRRPARKFCTKTCYRAYLAKRFDRWIANPEGLALPQNYDEFLDREVLQCVIDGCAWEGQWLSLHMNLAHGVPRAEFKRAAGFNLSTGVIARPLAQMLCERAKVGVALEPNPETIAHALAKAREKPIRYTSIEGREHRRKARAMSGPGPVRQCRGCQKAFQQTTPTGRALYCSKPCRNAHYAALKRAKAKRLVRQSDGRFKWETR